MISIVLLGLFACGDTPRLIATADLHPSQEDRKPNGGHYSASTQSFIRDHHVLDGATAIDLRFDSQDIGWLDLEVPDETFRFGFRNVPMRQLVPRLHYVPASPPDDFDAMNLLLAEYSRNGLSMPQGLPEDDLPHFESDLKDHIPWTLAGDYDFEPNPRYRPIRASVVNNCLSPGLWELHANDRTGELYHAWFDFPADLYAELIARTNGLDPAFARNAVQWRTDPVTPQLERLREPLGEAERTPAALAPDSGTGYSSQSSRRKLSRGFAMVDDQGSLRRPESRGELIALPAHVTDFVPPGKYAIDGRKVFDLTFLGQVQGADLQRVRPLTHYRAAEVDPGAQAREPDYLELTLDLGERAIVLGNLPMHLLVPQEDYVVNGFGVGILAPGTPAERRALLLENGHAPSFAYLLDTSEPAAPLVLNSHEAGVEQIFIRTHSRAEVPHWEITVTSFERIVDLAKYEVAIPPSLVSELREHADLYITPTYFSYRDDNVR